MLATIDQYSEEVFISGNPPIFVMDIRYSGTFVGQLHIPAQVVSISKNRMLLSRVDGLNFEGLLLSYKGDLSLRGIRIYTGRFDKLPTKIIKHSDHFNKKRESYLTLQDKYEDLGDTNKDYYHRKTLLSYRKGNREVYLCNGMRHTNVAKLPSKELKILKTIKEKNNGIK